MILRPRHHDSTPIRPLTFVAVLSLLAAIVTIQPSLGAATAASPDARIGASAGQRTTAMANGIMTISREGNTTFTRNFNPFSPNALYGTTEAIYEPMIIYNPARAAVVPWLASAYRWGNDGRTLTFTLRKNVTWSDGQPFTARDVAFTFGLVKKILGQGVYPYIGSVTATNTATVRFTFNQPYSPGLYEVGQQVIVPEHVWKSIKNPLSYTNPQPVGTGPFTVVKSFQPQTYELDRNPHYWQPGKPHIQGIRVPAYPGNDQANLATINGENDWADQYIPDIQKTFVDKDPAHRHYWFPALAYTVELYLNTTRKPFDNPNVRKAISMAINREQDVLIGEYGYTHPADATGLSDAFNSWRDPAAVKAGFWTAYNVAKANQMLDAAGLKRGSDGIRRLPNGTPMKYSIIVGAASTDWVASSQVIAQNLKQVGIDVSVKAQDWSTVIDEMQKGQFDMAHAWSGNGPTPYDFYRSVMSSETYEPIGTAANENYGRYVDHRADALLKQFAATFNKATQKAIVDKLQMLYVEDAPAIPLFPLPSWGEYNTTRFVGFPDKNNPYGTLETRDPTAVIVLTTVKPR